MHGYNIVFDANANSLHVFDDLTAGLIKELPKVGDSFVTKAMNAAEDKYSEADILEAKREINALIADGQLFAPDSDELGGDTVDESAAGTMDESVAGTMDESSTGIVDESTAGTMDESSAGIVDESTAGTMDESSAGTTDESTADIVDVSAADSLDNYQVFKSLCMHMAHDCNMKCAYCFASEGNFGLARELMSFETACAAIDFAVSASASRTNIEIDFFGGEPLLNFDVIKRTVGYARRIESSVNKKFRFTLTTNGLLLNDEIIAFVNENMDNLVLSIDGRREVNDTMRKTLGGAGTHDLVLNNIVKITVGREKSWYVRGTYTAYNKDFSEDVLYLADQGFRHISVEPVVSPADRALEFSPGDGEALAIEYEKLAYAMHEREKQGKPLDFFHFNVDLEEGPCLARLIKGCGAGYEYAAVAPNGDIYPCHQFVGNESFRIGTVKGGITERRVSDAFRQTTIYSKNECRACWAKFFCGGGCAANAWHYNRDITKPNKFYCDLFRKRIECALWLKCAKYAETV
jgi:uncharacterized protein